MTVISIDLASKDYQGFGVAILRADADGISVALDRSRPIGQPTAAATADWINELAQKNEATHILLDGPQGWKSDVSTLVHSRRCERELNTPAKTGPIGIVKPKSYTAFAQFSIDLFERLASTSMWLYGSPGQASARVLIESFPLAAWKGLGLAHLPAKSRCKQADVDQCLSKLHAVFKMAINRSPTHDELQAIVAGIGGIQLATAGSSAVRVAGIPPVREGGVWCEGHIVCPFPPVSARVV